jgi:hypothetical protein
MRVTATISGATVVSTEKDFQVQFPNFADIVSNNDVKAKADNAWVQTKQATTQTSDREEGFWVRLNTQTGKYEFTTPTITGPSEPPGVGTFIDLGGVPADSIVSPNPLDTPIYTIANFHTHVALTYKACPPNGLTFRQVGPSSQQNGHPGDIELNNQEGVPGLVYDYVGSGDPPFIKCGDPLDGPATVYQSGPDRRLTPP